MNLSHDLPSRAARLMFCFLMALAWSGGLLRSTIAGAAAPPATPAPAAPAAGAGVGDLTDAEFDATLAVLDRLVKMADEEAHKSKDDARDPRALAARLGGQPGALFEFVRDKVKTEPYVGVLRGSLGALSAAAAGPADKAVLLAEMLAASGVSSRIVQGELPDQECGKLVDAFLAADPLAGPLGQALQTGEIGRAHV